VKGISEEDKKYQRWRFKDYPGKKPGRLVWNAASYSVFRHAVREIAPEKAGVLDELVPKFHESLVGKTAPAEFEQTMAQLQQLSGELVAMVERHQFTQKEVWSILRRITGDGSGIANAGFQSAEQAVLAITSLQESYARTVGSMPNAKGMTASINQLNDDIALGRKFNLERFIQHLAGLRKILEPEVPPTNGAAPATLKPAS
jgi:predicted XRE-type DNA-binding protein